MILAIALWPSAMRDVLIPRAGEFQRVKSTRIPFFDFIRGIAILGVIVIHVVKVLADAHPGWVYQGFGLSAMSRFAIGFFFIASGALISRHSSCNPDYWMPKFWRIFVPYAFIVALYLMIEPFTIQEYPYLLISGKAEVPFYFISVLFQLYLLYFIIKPFRDAWWFLPLNLFLSILLFFVVRTLEFQGIPIGARFIFFLAYGMAHANRLQSLIPLPHTLPFLILVLTYCMLTNIYVGHYNNEQFIYSVALFELMLLAYHKGWIPQGVKKIVTMIGSVSLWIFLIHYPITKVCVEWAVTHSLPPLLTGFILTVLVSVPASFHLQRIYKRLIPSQ